jgi:hypothetical protein
MDVRNTYRSGTVIPRLQKWKANFSSHRTVFYQAKTKKIPDSPSYPEQVNFFWANTE